MRVVAAVLMSLAASQVMAMDSNEEIPVEHYQYSQHLDIKRVISQERVPDVCGVVATHMTYEDSAGRRHILEYRVLGDGCSNN